MPTITASDFRNGVTFEMDGQVMQVVEFQHVKPGKGAAFVRTKMKNVITGGVTETSFNPTAKFEQAYVERKDMEYSYNDGDLYYFMDPETYDLVPIGAELLGDNFRFVKENMVCKINSYKGKIFAVEPPTFVELEITETDPGFRGDTATNVTKPATLETGAEIEDACSSTPATRSRSTPAPASTWSVARPDCLPDFRGGGRASAGVGGPAQRGAPPAHAQGLPEAKQHDGIQFRRANEIKGFPRKACFAWDSPAPASTWSAARPDCLPDFRGGGRASAGVGGPAQRGAPLAHTSVLPEAKPWRKAEFSSALQMKSKGSRAKCALRGTHPHRRVPGALQGVSARTPGNRRTANRADEKAVVP